MLEISIGSLADLEQRYRKKILLSDGTIRNSGNEMRDHWYWTASFVQRKPGRNRKRHIPENYQGSASPFITVNDRGTPTVHDPATGAAAAAHRFIYGKLTGTPTCDVPRLQRCAHDRCVNPYHAVIIGEPPKPRTTTVAAVDADGILEILKGVRPFHLVDSEAFPIIEDECGLPAGSITAQIWFKYYTWAETNPEEDLAHKSDPRPTSGR